MPHSVEIAQAPTGPRVLTEEQQSKVRELWYEMGKLIGLDVDGIAAEHGAQNLREQLESSTAASASSPTQQKKGRFGGSKKEESGNDKHGSNKQFQNAIAEMSHQELRDALWDFSKCDDPDSNLCRYLRARKWVVKDALVMLVSTIHWRNRVMHLDDDVLLHGEEDAIKIAQGDMAEVGALTKRNANDWMEQLRMGKAFVHGRDRFGRPMCFIRVKLHKIGAHTTASVERLVVYMIETARFMLDPPNQETVTIVFDMTDFGMTNMDYGPLKFVIKVFEANYPESLGAIMIHRAPWVFQTVWGAIKGWLDPVVASKIHFTKEVGELAQYIDLDTLPEFMGGNEDWTYSYPEPIPGENSKMNDVATKEKLEAERRVLLDNFEDATIKWVVANGVNDEKLVARRKEIGHELYVNYWQLDPYIRARSILDRQKIIGPRIPIPDPTAKASTGQNNGSSMTNGHSTSIAALAVAGSPPMPTRDAPATPDQTVQRTATSETWPASPSSIITASNAANAMPLDLNVQELEFRRPLNKELTTQFKLRNPNNAPVVFKVMITAPKQYLIRPSSGRINSGEELQVSVVMLPMKEEPSPNIVCGAKLLVRSVAVSSNRQISLSPEWWAVMDQIADSPVQEKKIRVNYLPSSGQPMVSGVSGHDNNMTNGDNTITEQLRAQLAQAQSQIALLTNQAQESLKQRKAQSKQQAQLALQQAPGGVPLSITAGVCLLSFLLAYLLF